VRPCGRSASAFSFSFASARSARLLGQKWTADGSMAATVQAGTAGLRVLILLILLKRGGQIRHYSGHFIQTTRRGDRPTLNRQNLRCSVLSTPR